MKSVFQKIVVLATVCFAAVAGHAQPVAQPIVGFNFNDVLIPSARPAAPQTFTPDRGTGTNITFIDGDDADAVSFDPIATFNGTGTTVNAFPGDAAGADFGAFVGLGNINNGDGFQFSFSTLNIFDPIEFSYATIRDTGGFTTQTLQFSTNNGLSFTNIGTVTPTTIYTASPKFTLDNAVNNQAAVIIRFILDGGTQETSSNRFDNIQVNAIVPEPGTVTLMGLGLAGLIASRRRKKEQAADGTKQEADDSNAAAV